MGSKEMNDPVVQGQSCGDWTPRPFVSELRNSKSTTIIDLRM